MFSPYVAAGQNELKVKRDGVEAADVYGTNVGGGLKVAVPLTSSILVHADGRTLTEVTTHDKDAREASSEGLLEGEVAASVDIIEKYVDVVVGYKHRSYSFKVEDETFDEVQSAPFAGMRLGLYF